MHTLKRTAPVNTWLVRKTYCLHDPRGEHTHATNYATSLIIAITWQLLAALLGGGPSRGTILPPGSRQLLGLGLLCGLGGSPTVILAFFIFKQAQTTRYAVIICICSFGLTTFCFLNITACS